jgi:regulatory protein
MNRNIGGKMYTVEEFDKEKTKVMKYIMYKKRTEQEVKNKFQNTIQKDLLCDIISYIKEAGYLDDSDYVKRTVSEFMALKNLSSREIKYKLYTKGVKKDIIEDYFYNNSEEIDEYEKKSAQNIVVKKQTLMEKEEIEKYLLKKGYNEQIIKEVLECKNY